MTKTVAKYIIFIVTGVMLGYAGYHPFAGYQYWIWFTAMMIAVYARDWGRSNK